MTKYIEKTGVEGERVVLLAQDPTDTTKYIPINHSNQLPIANYVKTAAGLWVPQKCADDGAVLAQLTGSYPALATPWTMTGDSAANTAITLTKNAVAGKSHYITAIEVVISAAAAAVDISCILKEDAAGIPVNMWKEIVGNASPRGARVGITFPLPVKLSTNKTADLLVDAGGAGVITTLNLSGFTL